MAACKETLSFAEVQLVVGSWKTVLAVKAPTNQMVRLLNLRLAANGQAGDAESVQMRWVRITAASGTGTATAPIKTNNALSVTPQATGRVNFSGEPSEDGSSPYLYRDRFHPQGGLPHTYDFSEFLIKEATEVALQMQVPTGGSAVKVDGHVELEE